MSFQNMKNTALDVTGAGGESDNIFELKLDNVKILSHILKVLNFKEMATCFVSENGLKIVVEDAKCVQVSAFVGADLFQEFHIAEDVAFKVDLNVLLDCLSLFDNCSIVPGATTALKMYCTHIGAPLKLLLEESGVITDCSLKTLEADDVLDFDFPASSVVNKVILQAGDFKDVFNELDPTSECVGLLLSPDAPFFQITTTGVAGDCQVHILPTSEMIEAFQCTKEIKSRYRFSQIRPAMKPLAVSMKVSVRTDDVGLLCLQFMVQTETKQLCYIEYYEFHIAEDVAFKVDLNVLLDCLSLFDNCSIVPGATTALKMYCTHIGAPLKLLLEESGVITDCSLKTLEADDVLDFDFPASSVVNKVILQAGDFKDVFNELDPTSECVGLLLSPDAPFFQITTTGVAGDCQVHILPTSEMIEAFQCTKEIKSRYRFSQIRPAMKPLAVSMKVSVRTDDVGLLCLQFMVQTETKQLCYIEYYCTPVVDDA